MATGETKRKVGRPTSDERLWTVLCENAKPTPGNPTGEQVHETRDGTPYKLFHNKGTEMPARHAIDFLIDPAFHVHDEFAERVFPRVASSAGAPVLQPGQVVVSLAELSDQAILVRAMQVNPLAEKKLGRDALIKIIETGAISADDEGEGVGEDAAGEAELGNDE